jgi:acetylornithine deacetylase/succinyl-diaminopimelate desuccinylase-like protein
VSFVRTVPGAAFLLAAVAVGVVSFQSARAQRASTPDWAAVDPETMQHFQALLRLDTSNPPGNERLAANYLQSVLEREGIESHTYELEAGRANLVARLKGSGRRQPILFMGHTDVVTVDPRKWRFPPFSATRDGGFIYGRGSVDDKPHVVAGLMTMILLKRLQVPLDRDVIFLAEAGEEGTSHVGIDFMLDKHESEIRAEYCLAEGGGVTRADGVVKYATVQTMEKLPRSVELTAHGTSGHGSRPLADNAIVHLSAAVAAVGAWRAPIRLNATTREYFRRLAELSPPDEAARYFAILEPSSSAAARAADDYFVAREPNHASMVRTSVAPTILSGGYRVNVIPSEAKATLDVRMLPDENPDEFLQRVRTVVNDPLIDVAFAAGHDERPAMRTGANLESEGFRTIESVIKKHYQTTVLPMMSTGATDMAQLRAKGVQCYGVGPATDREEASKGFGAHSDQERILESELQRFVHFAWDAVYELARAH